MKSSCLLVLCLTLWAPEAPAAFIPTIGSSQVFGTGSGSSFTPSQFGTTVGESFGSAGSNASQIGANLGYSAGLTLTSSNVDTHDSSYNDAKIGAGSSTQGSSRTYGLAANGGFGKFGFGKASSSSNAQMNSNAKTIWKPDGLYGPSSALAAGGGTAGSAADSLSYGPMYLSLDLTQSSVNTNIKTFGNDNESGTTGSVVGSSNGFGFSGSSNSNTTVQIAGAAQHAGQFGIAAASAGGKGHAGGNSGAGIVNFLGLSSSNVQVKKKTTAGNGRSSSSSSTSAKNFGGLGGFFG